MKISAYACMCGVLLKNGHIDATHSRHWALCALDRRSKKLMHKTVEMAKVKFDPYPTLKLSPHLSSIHFFCTSAHLSLFFNR